IWLTIASTASPTALSPSGISSTICIVGHPPSLGLLLPLRCHGSAPFSTALLSCSPCRTPSPAQDESHTLQAGAQWPDTQRFVNGDGLGDTFDLRRAQGLALEV